MLEMLVLNLEESIWRTIQEKKKNKVILLV